MSVNSRLKAPKFMSKSKETILQAENSSLVVQGKKQTVDINSNSNSKYILCHVLQKTCFIMSGFNNTQQTKSLLKASKGLFAEWVRTNICLLVIFWKNHVWKDGFVQS